MGRTSHRRVTLTANELRPLFASMHSIAPLRYGVEPTYLLPVGWYASAITIYNGYGGYLHKIAIRRVRDDGFWCDLMIHEWAHLMLTEHLISCGLSLEDASTRSAAHGNDFWQRYGRLYRALYRKEKS